MPQAASPAIPRVAVRLVPAQGVIGAEANADRCDRTSVSSVEVAPRFKLKSGSEPKTLQATHSTLKIMTQARVDSPPRPEKPE